MHCTPSSELLLRMASFDQQANTIRRLGPLAAVLVSLAVRARSTHPLRNRIAVAAPQVPAFIYEMECSYLRFDLIPWHTGTYIASTGSTACLACPAGKYCGKSEIEIACRHDKCSSSGKYNAGTGATICTNCTAGKKPVLLFQPYSGCTSFDIDIDFYIGYYKITTGGSSISSCVACPAGESILLVVIVC